MATQTLLDDFLTVDEAAAQLRVASSTIRRWIREGDLPAYRIGKRRTAIKRADVSAQISPARERENQDHATETTTPPAIPPLTAEERRRGLEIVEELRQIRQRMLDERGGKPFTSSAELVRQMRDERSRELSELL